MKTERCFWLSWVCLSALGLILGTKRDNLNVVPVLGYFSPSWDGLHHITHFLSPFQILKILVWAGTAKITQLYVRFSSRVCFPLFL